MAAKCMTISSQYSFRFLSLPPPPLQPKQPTNLVQSKIVLMCVVWPTINLRGQIIYSELNVGFVAIYLSQYLNQ